MALPPVALPGTDGAEVRLDTLPGPTVVFAYPRTARPGEEVPGGTEEWNAIPGARGCSLEARAFAASHEPLRALMVIAGERVEHVFYPVFRPTAPRTRSSPGSSVSRRAAARCAGRRGSRSRRPRRRA
jgi:hypothetical protein